MTTRASRKQIQLVSRIRGWAERCVFYARIFLISEAAYLVERFPDFDITDDNTRDLFNEAAQIEDQEGIHNLIQRYLASGLSYLIRLHSDIAVKMWSRHFSVQKLMLRRPI